MSVFSRISTALARLLGVLVVTMVVVMTCALGAQVLLRYAFNITLSWSEELSLGLFTWTVLLTSALGVREGFHVRMALLLDPMPAAVRRESERVIHLATCAVAVPGLGRLALRGRYAGRRVGRDRLPDRTAARVRVRVRPADRRVRPRVGTVGQGGRSVGTRDRACLTAR